MNKYHITFSYANKDVLPVHRYTQGEPCFKGIDVARRLGYTDPYHVLSDHVELVDRITGQFDQKVGRPSTYINESGMYALIFGSKKPEGLSIAQRKAEYNEAFRQSLTY